MLKPLRLINFQRRLEKRKIQRAVWELREKENLINEISVPALQEIMKCDQSKSAKISWIVILIGCLSFISYQIFDRVAFYLSYPVVIDVKNVIEDEMELPLILICTTDTPVMNEFMQDLVYSDDVTFEKYGDYRCLNIFLTLIKDKRVDMNTLYAATNISSVFKGIYVKKANPQVDLNIKIKEVNFSFGICKLFKLDRPATHHLERSSASVKFCRPHKTGCVTSVIAVSLVKFEEYPNLKQSFLHPLGITSKHWFSISKFEFINSPKNPCVDDKTFLNCFRICLIKRLQANLTCRFPFTPPEIDKPKCETSDEAYDNYATGYADYEDLDPIADCQCPRQCTLVNYQQSAESTIPKSKEGESITLRCIPESKDECCTEIGLEFKGNNVISHKERLLYDAIALLSDIGGNLGLSLNLSLLATIQLMLTTWKLTTIKKSYLILNETKLVSPEKLKIIYNKVVADATRKNSSVNLKQFLQVIVFVVVFAMSFYIVFSNFSYYWFEPVTTIVKVTLPNTVQFPDVTICGEVKLQMNRLNVAKKLKSLHNKQVDSCSLSPWELIDRNPSKTLSVETIWKKLNLVSTFSPNPGNRDPKDDMGKHLSGIAYWPTLDAKQVSLPYGNCTKFTAKESKFQGTISVHSIGLKSKIGVEDIFCNKRYFKYFLTPPNEPTDLASIISVPFYVKSLLWLLIKKINRLNTYSNPCVSSHDFLKCKYDCFAKEFAKAMHQLNCRLPFINSSLPYCTTSDDAARVNNAYLKIYLKTNPPNDCKCVKRCNETIYDVQMFTTPIGVETMSLVNLIFYTNLIESFVEVKAYPLSKLLSDIGSCLGLFLGFNLLSPLNFVRMLKFRLSQKVTRKKTKKTVTEIRCW